MKEENKFIDLTDAKSLEDFVVPEEQIIPDIKTIEENFRKWEEEKARRYQERKEKEHREFIDKIMSGETTEAILRNIAEELYRINQRLEMKQDAAIRLGN